MNRKTLNLHFTDYCNFTCGHCFVNLADRSLTLQQCKLIIDKVRHMNEFKRINIAGGEPMLIPYLQEIIDYINDSSFECSIITNGSKLTKNFIEHNKDKLTMIGISIDSMNDDINSLIGRKTIKDIYELSKHIKDNNIKLKINICVSKHNLNENFADYLKIIKPDRLKVFQMVPSDHAKDSKDLFITKKEFKEVCSKLLKFDPVCEDNEYMLEAYYIVDSKGYYGKDNLHVVNEEKIYLL